MKKHLFLYLAAATIILILISSCAKTKTEVETVAAPPKPIDLAHAATKAGEEAFQNQLLDEAKLKFKEAIVQFEAAAPTAAATDSIDVNIERMHINIAKVNIDLATESTAAQMHSEAIEQLQEALDSFKKIQPITIPATEKDEIIKSLYIRLAYANQSAGSYEDALLAYDEVLKMEPGNEEILNNKYVILNDNIKDETRAFQVLKDYAQASNDYRAYLILGTRYNEKKNVAEATKYYEQALTLNKSADVLTRVSDFYRSNSNWAASNKVLDQLVATKPDNATLAAVYRLMGDNYSKLKNNAKKADAWEKSLALEQNGEIALAVAKHYYDAKNYNKAVTYATQAINQDSGNAAAYLLRGDCYYKLKKNAQAKADLQRIQNDPQHGSTAQKLLKAIK